MLHSIRKLLKKRSTVGLKQKGQFYRKSLVWILAASAIPGILIGTLMYWIGNTGMETQLQRLHNSQIEKRAQNIDDQLSYLEMALSHWAFAPRFNADLQKKLFFKDYQDAWDISKTLLIMQGAYPLAQQVELYLQGSTAIVFNPEYQHLDNADKLLIYNRLLKQGKSVYWAEWTEPNEPDRRGGQKRLTLVHKIPGDSPNPFGVLMIHMDREKLIGLLKTLTPYEQGETFLMTEQRDVLISTGVDSKAVSFQDALKQEVWNQGASTGSFLFDWDKSTYTVSYGTLARVAENWIYVSAAPVNAITIPVIRLSKLVLAFSALVLLVALFLSWVASRRIYSPVDQLLRRLAGVKSINLGTGDRDEFRLIEEYWQHLHRESSALQNRLEEQLPHVQEGFLLQLLQGHLGSFTEKDLLDRMKHYGWTVDRRRFIVLYIQLTGFVNLEGPFSHDDEGLVTFAAANIIEELAAGLFEQAEVINFHDLRIGLLVIGPDDDSYREQKLVAFGEEALLAISRILKMQATLTLGRSTRSITEVPTLFEEAVQAVNYRTFEIQNQLLDMEKIVPSDHLEAPRYPFVLERDIVQKLKTGYQTEAEQQIAEFLKAVSDGRAKEMDVQQAMLQLLGSILHAIRQAGIDPNRLYRGVNLYEQLAQIRDPQQMRKWFGQKLISPYIKELETRSDHHLKKMAESVMVYIQNHFTDDISLEQCADLTGTNPYFLSKTFKQVTGKNFIDYLTEVRMEKAKELLSETELKINEVAEKTGYQSSYFNRIFRKQEGMTPSQYREIHSSLSMDH